MEFRVLGPAELWSDGRQFDLGPARERGVLAILLLTPRTIVPAATLIDRLWDSEPPAKARESLSVYVARLRASLRRAIGNGVRLEGRLSGYALDVDPEAVDLHRFRGLRRKADALVAGGDLDGAARLLREADGFWRGQPLAGIRGDWIARMRVSLEDERRAAILQRIECELELGWHFDLIGELRGLLAQYPLDEALVAHQMQALYRSGRPGDALVLYRETRDQLVAEQGTEPGLALSDLHQRILRQDHEVSVRVSGQRQAQLAPRREPAALARRGAELDRLGDAGAVSHGVMAAFELSYLALEPPQRRFLRRLSMNPCDEVGPHAAAALGGGTLAETEKALLLLRDNNLLAEGEDGRFRFHYQIRDFAAARAAHEDSGAQRRQATGRLLDYYLHVADAAARMLQPFRHHAPVQVKKRPAVSPRLATADAAAVWLESEWRNILQVAQHAGEHEWKRQCADLTHLVAAFVDINGYWEDAIAAHRLALQAARDLDDQPRIARASIELSVVSQQAGQHEAALSLAEDAAVICRLLADDRGQAEALDQIGLVNQRAARSREALAYFDEAETLFCVVADPHGRANTLSHSGIARWHLGHYQDAMGQLKEALALYQEVGDRRGEAKTLNNLGKMQLHCGLHRDALDSFERSLEIFGVIGGAQNRAILYHNIGAVCHYKGSYEKGLAAYQHALELYREIGDLPDEADVLNDIGAIYQSAERYDEALTRYQQARLIAENVGNLSFQVAAMRGIADVRRGSGRYADAFETYAAALTLARQIGDPYEEAKILEGIAEATHSTHRPHAARILLRQALDIYKRLGVHEAEAATIRLETIGQQPLLCAPMPRS
jgi:DNA-binding SARP family transcriptional activator